MEGVYTVHVYHVALRETFKNPENETKSKQNILSLTIHNPVKTETAH